MFLLILFVMFLIECCCGNLIIELMFDFFLLFLLFLYGVIVFFVVGFWVWFFGLYVFGWCLLLEVVEVCDE